ncbi:MAG: hypothetical protein KGK07_08590 [Chloroflexota bacterium]|nr:hypothetical protein [Chloroflexota bacterium]
MRWTVPRLAAVAVLLLVGASAVIGYTAGMDVPVSYLGRTTVPVTPPPAAFTATPSPRSSATARAVDDASSTPAASATPVASTATPAAVATASPTAADTPSSVPGTPVPGALRPAPGSASPTPVVLAPRSATPSLVLAPLPVTATPAPTASQTSAPAATATPAISPAPALTFGNAAPAFSIDSSDYAYLNGSDATLAFAGTLLSLSVYVGATAPGAHLRLALYRADATGDPGALLVQTPATAAVVGWNTLPSPPLALAAGTYWIVAQTDSPATVYGYTTGPPSVRWGWAPYTYGPFPVSAGPWQLQAGHSFAMYGTVAGT